MVPVEIPLRSLQGFSIYRGFDYPNVQGVNGSCRDSFEEFTGF